MGFQRANSSMGKVAKKGTPFQLLPEQHPQTNKRGGSRASRRASRTKRPFTANPFTRFVFKQCVTGKNTERGSGDQRVSQARQNPKKRVKPTIRSTEFRSCRPPAMGRGGHPVGGFCFGGGGGVGFFGCFFFFFGGGWGVVFLVGFVGVGNLKPTCSWKAMHSTLNA